MTKQTLREIGKAYFPKKPVQAWKEWATILLPYLFVTIVIGEALLSVFYKG